MNIVNNFVSILNEIKNTSNKKKNIQIIVVSKNFDFNHISPILKIGHNHFGENRVNEALSKWSEEKKINPNLNIHLIGRLQSNKIKDALKIFSYIHSLDSEKLALLLDIEQKKSNIYINYLIQVNVGNEKQKSGVSLEKVNNFISFCKNNTRLNIIGLMCIPPLGKPSDYYFKILSQIAHENNLKELSMGMSNDYKSAILHGSTFVRIGSLIFGSRVN